jgi:hypothetical protein
MARIQSRHKKNQYYQKKEIQKGKLKKKSVIKKKNFIQNQKRGGAINVPIYLSRTSPEEDVCKPLTKLNSKIKDNIENKENEQVKLSQIESLIVDDKQLNATIPLFKFKQFLTNMCDPEKFGNPDDNQKHPYILVDKYRNHVQSNYTEEQDIDEVHVFRITDKFQIEYLGMEKKTRHPLYDFESLYDIYFLHDKPSYSLNTLVYLKNINLFGEFYKLEKIKYFEYDDKTYINKEYDFELKKYSNFLKNNFLYYSLRDQEGNPTNVLVPIVNSLIKNITFINRMEEFIKLVDNDYEFFFTNNFLKLLKEYQEKEKEKSKLEKLYQNFLDNMIPEKIKKKISTKMEAEALKQRFKNVILTGKDDTGLNLKKFKSNLLSLMNAEDETEISQPLVLNLDFLIYLYIQLFGSDVKPWIKEPENDTKSESDTEENKFRYFLYICILIHISDFYNLFNPSKSENQTSVDGNSNTELLEGYLEIQNAFIYIDLSTTLDKDVIKKPSYLRKFYVNPEEQTLIFYDDMVNFITELHQVRREFLEHDVGYCNEILKNLFLTLYIYYLNNNQSDFRRPFSIKTHIDKYLQGSRKNETLTKIEFESSEELKMRLVPQDTVVVEKNDETKYFTNCGERTLMNFFKYLLFDKNNGFITDAKIKELQDKYPDNLLSDFFNSEILNKNDKLQTIYLNKKKSEFATRISTYADKLDIKMFSRNYCEINPNESNMIKMILYLLNGTKEPDETNIEDLRGKLLEILNNFGFERKGIDFKTETSTKISLSLDQKIKFIFSDIHGDVFLIKNKSGNETYKNTLSIFSSSNDTDSLFNCFIKINNNYEVFNKRFDYNPIDLNSNFMAYEIFKMKIEEITISDSLLKIINKNIDDEKFIMDTIEIININDNCLIQEPPLNLSIIFPKLKKVNFGDIFNQEIKIDSMPKVKEIFFSPGSNFNNGGQPFFKGCFPELENINFGNAFNQEIEVGSMPKVKKIFFPHGSNFNNGGQSFKKGCFPELENIDFGNAFNQEIEVGSMPKVTKILFKDKSEFNNGGKPLKDGCFLKLEKVNFGNAFNQNITPEIMPNIERIEFTMYNKENPIMFTNFSKLTSVTEYKNRRHTTLYKK